MSDYLSQFFRDLEADDLRNVTRELERSKRELERRTLEVETLDHITTVTGTNLDSLGENPIVMPLRYMLRATVAETQMCPTVVLKKGSINQDSILSVCLTGFFFQNSTINQTMRVRIYLGKAGSEIDISFANTYTIVSQNVKRPFSYEIMIYAAPDGSVGVLCEETFTYNAQSTSIDLESPQKRIRQTTLTGLENLNDIDSLYITFELSLATSVYQVTTTSIVAQLHKGIPMVEKRWWSQPIGTDAYDTYINSFAPTTNYYTNATINSGEGTGGSNTARTLIKFPSLENIPANAQIESAILYLVISQDLSANARTLSVYRMTTDWDQTTCTWNKKNATDDWSAAGATGDFDTVSPLGSASFGAAEPINTQKAIALDVDEFQKFIDGTYSDYGFMLKMATESDDLYGFYSGNTASLANEPLAPMLEVIYTIPQ